MSMKIWTRVFRNILARGIELLPGEQTIAEHTSLEAKAQYQQGTITSRYGANSPGAGARGVRSMSTKLGECSFAGQNTLKVLSLVLARRNTPKVRRQCDPRQGASQIFEKKWHARANVLKTGLEYSVSDPTFRKRFQMFSPMSWERSRKVWCMVQICKTVSTFRRMSPNKFS